MMGMLARRFAVGVALLLMAPDRAVAQSSVGSDGWWDWAAPIVDGRGQQSRRSQGQGQRQGQGPPFCRGNGRGHPVHGPEWCRAKGWEATWSRGGWEDVILRNPRRGGRGGVYERDTLSDILGQVVFGRLENQRRRVGASGPMQGRWVQGRDGAQVLQIRAGGIPIAEFTDLNGNGRADVVLLNSR
jgi:hypothetical protein